MNFSQRIGKAPATKQLQLESMDDDLRNGLWNVAKIYFIDLLSKGDFIGTNEFNKFCINLWNNLLKYPIDTIPSDDYYAEEVIRNYFFVCEWHEAYSFLESIANYTSSPYVRISVYIQNCNSIFEREFSAYRFIDGLITPISNKEEIEVIKKSIDVTKQYTGLKGSNIHLHAALEKLSNRKKPDYRNSIKESISAVESVAKAISGNEKDSLGAALDKIKGKIKLHQALERGFKQLYGYTSDADGIRHALMESSTCDFEDAKYMLVSSSAFINYLIVKSDKAGIKLS